MIRRDIHIDQYDWIVHVYLHVTCYRTKEIIRRLKGIGCPMDKLHEAYDNMMSCSLDTGLTYSNYERRESVMVIGPTSSYREFANSLLHETRHLTDHVCLAMGMEIGEDPIAYLAGYIGSALADEIRLFVCDCCHEEERKRIINGKKKKHTQGTRRFYKT